MGVTGVNDGSRLLNTQITGERKSVAGRNLVYLATATTAEG